MKNLKIFTVLALGFFGCSNHSLDDSPEIIQSEIPKICPCSVKYKIMERVFEQGDPITQYRIELLDGEMWTLNKSTYDSISYGDPAPNCDMRGRGYEQCPVPK